MSIEVVEKKIPTRKVAYVPHTDSFSKIPEFINEVAQLIKENNFEATGLVYGSYDNGLKELAENEQIFEIGMSIKTFEANGMPAGRIGKLGLKEVTEHTALTARHVGSHKTFNKTVEAVINYAVENSYDIVGPITEVYLPADENTPVEEVETEIQIPVVYMGSKK